jgi:hypothetical protein
MTDDNNTTAGLAQADEDILSYTVSDEALELQRARNIQITRFIPRLLIAFSPADPRRRTC